MSRLFSILVSLFILFLVYLWINHITHRNEIEPQVKTEQPSKSVPKEPKTKPTPKTPAPSNTEKATQESREPPVQEKKVEEKPRPKAKVSSAIQGGHLVVAGNFLERTNAEKHLKSIRDLGYSEAEILNFEISQYYTVIAGRYDDLAEARRVAKKLKDMHGVDTYVRNGN